MILIVKHIHIEVNKEMVKDWVREYFDSQDKFIQRKAREIMSSYSRIERKFIKQARLIWRNFNKIIDSHR